MVLPLLIAAGGMLASQAGQEQGARATQREIARETQREYELGQKRQASIRQLLTQIGPAAQLQRDLAESEAHPQQQDEIAAIRKAYGVDNPAVGQAMAALGPSVNDAAWQRAFGLGANLDKRAIADDTGRQHDIDARQWWLQRFMPNRIARAGESGRDLRVLGQVATAYGLGQTNARMAMPTTPTAYGQAGSDAVNAQTGDRLTSDLNDPSWLGLSR